MAHPTRKMRKLKNLLILPAFQIKLLTYFLVLFVITTLTLYSTTYLFFWRLKEKALGVGIPPKHVFFQFIGDMKGDLDLLYVLLAGCNLLLLMGVGLLVSHRIAGPIFKMRHYLTNLDRNTPEFQLRNNDFLKEEMVPGLNSLREKIK